MFSLSSRDPGFESPSESKGSTIIMADIVLMCVASMTILVRVYVKAFMLKNLGLDDGEPPFLLIPGDGLQGKPTNFDHSACPRQLFALDHSSCTCA